MGEKAYETLLGFAFGGSLLALFMRVGGGIYTKAADVGADLVGKVERDIPEDDPRNAATIADNVGDNVGDCAGMAADVFESYTVTMVAAMILGYAAFRHAGDAVAAFHSGDRHPQQLGQHVARRPQGRRRRGSSGAMRAINRQLPHRRRPDRSLASLVLGAIFLRFDKPYIVTQAVERGLYRMPEFRTALGLPAYNPQESADRSHSMTHAATRRRKPGNRSRPKNVLPSPTRPSTQDADGNAGRANGLRRSRSLGARSGRLDFRPAFACLVGIALTLALMFCTEYWTSTEFHPVRSITKNSRTGDATNIIQGIAVGYESTVWAVILIAAAVFAGVFIYQESNSPLFVAFGVSLAGIGMLALTADTLSMDVFGPVADNASGIGEMGYNRDPDSHRALTPGEADYIPEPEVKAARQILTDLDAHRQHDQGHHQGHRHRLGGDCRRLAVRELHRRAGEGQRRTHRPIDGRRLPQQRRAAFRSHAGGLHRHADWRGGAVPVQQHDDSGRRPGGISDRQRMPPAVPGQGRSGKGTSGPITAGSSIFAPAPPSAN